VTDLGSKLKKSIQKKPTAPAGKREAEVDWGNRRWTRAAIADRIRLRNHA
jgi:hypothetical protein